MCSFVNVCRMSPLKLSMCLCVMIPVARSCLSTDSSGVTSDLH